MIARGPAPTVTIEEALSSTAKRLERDIELAAWHGMDHGRFVAFLDRLREFDRRTPLWEARQDALAMVERVIAILEAEAAAA